METEINTEHEQGILETIRENPVYCFKDIFVFYKQIARRTGYDHRLHELHSIKEAIGDNKRKGVTSMIKKWIDSDNATLNIAAMRLLSDADERQKLNQQYIDHTSKNEAISIILQKGHQQENAD